MDELISRRAAIDAVNRYGSVWMEYTEAMSIDEIAERALKASKQSMTKILHDLPSAQLRPRGRWIPNYIYHYEERFVCSVCKRSYKVDTCMGKPTWDFCPNCGADMRGEQDGRHNQ